jgi:hypothetical protein
MHFADLAVQGIDLEMAKHNLDGVVEDVDRLKVMIAEMLDEPTFTNVDVLTPGSRFRKLIMVKSLLNSVGIDAFAARRGVKSALAYQQASFPQPEDVA